MPPHNFRNLFAATIDFLIKEKTTYVLIGGMASDVWGRPRKTLDIDIVISTSPEGYEDFLSKAGKYNFTFTHSKAIKQLKSMGMCRLYYGSYHADFIMGYSEFEQTVFKRRRKVEIFGRSIYVASPEDIILYKLVSGRPIDQSDINNIVITQGNKLDKKYLKSRAYQMQKDLFRTDITDNLIKILNDIR